VGSVGRGSGGSGGVGIRQTAPAGALWQAEERTLLWIGEYLHWMCWVECINGGARHWQLRSGRVAAGGSCGRCSELG